jgi:hypothetical protein
MFNQDRRIEIIDEKLKLFESIYKEMSQELRKGMDKLSSVNDSIVTLLNRNDVRMSLLENKGEVHEKNFEELKALIERCDANRAAQINSLILEVESNKQKLVLLDKLMYACIIVITGVVTVAGIVASSGWLSPERFIEPTIKPPGFQQVLDIKSNLV